MTNSCHGCLQNCYRTINGRYELWNPDMLGYNFFAEAKRLWEVEIHNDGSVTTFQAAMVFSATYNLYTMDNIDLSYGIAAVQLAGQLNVFAAYDDMSSTSEVEQQAYIYTAWGM